MIRTEPGTVYTSHDNGLAASELISGNGLFTSGAVCLLSLSGFATTFSNGTQATSLRQSEAVEPEWLVPLVR